MDKSAYDWRSYVVGAFVTWQLLFLPLSNFIKFFPARIRPVRGELGDDGLQFRMPLDAKGAEPWQTLVDAVAVGTLRWAELAGEVQFWSLFAPDHAHQGTLPRVELRWRDRPPVVLKSTFEPADASKHFMLPSPQCRLFNYEIRTILVYWRYYPGDETKRPEYWRDLVIEWVSDLHNSVEAYMQWRMNKYLAENPKVPKPDAVVIFARSIPTRHPPDRRDKYAEENDTPYSMPLARWRPGVEPRKGFLKLEAWDLLKKQFVPVEAPSR